MEKGKDKSKGTEYPDGVNVIADLGYGLVVAKVDISAIREQDKNAHIMKPEMFQQLAENIKKRGGMESLPFCALTDKVEIVSGHHRVRAAKEAGLKHVVVLLDTTGLTRSQIAAKQIAHNAINGFDDQSMLKEIAKLISDVDDMIESYIGKDVLGEPLAALDKLLSPIIDFDWKQIQLVFLPHQLKNLDLFVQRTGTAEYTGAAHIEQYEQLLQTLQKYQKFKNIQNLGSAIYKMIEVANAEMEQSEYDNSEEWMTLSSIFGSAAIPATLHLKVKDAFEKMKKGGQITDNTRWKALEILSDTYLNNY